ncbi:hypothetical protein [Adlercreutzia sp. ZJ141]|uniref:hypothetical protein n=1 Tax=Adlercreutzia sp. ZJ141 TaxID=2709406 RepID=UPI0013EDC49C|nr:hypothetical protein [Adlercreutzia sp. ZJ141]
MTRKREEYDWLNDPFDEKKCAEELQRARGSKATGCLVAFVAVVAVALLVALGMGVIGALSSGLSF